MARERTHRTGRVRPYPTLWEIDHRREDAASSPRDASDYWSDRERWEEMGRRVTAFRDQAKRDGVPIETLPGARSLIDSFKALGRRLDRHTR